MSSQRRERNRQATVDRASWAGLGGGGKGKPHVTHHDARGDRKVRTAAPAPLCVVVVALRRPGELRNVGKMLGNNGCGLGQSRYDGKRAFSIR